jgi:hypothetical protein
MEIIVMKNVNILLVFILALFLFTPTIDASSYDKEKKGNWSNPEVVSTESTANAYRGVIAVDHFGTIHIAWKDKSDYQGIGTNWHICYKNKPKGGNWTTTEIVSTESTGDGNCLSMVVDQNVTVHIVWKDNSNYNNIGSNWHIFYKNKPKDGNWTVTEIVSTESSGNCGCPSLAVDSNNTIHVTWADDSEIYNSGDDEDIFYRSRLKNGYWTDYELVSTDSTADSLEPSIDVDSENTVYIAWAEMVGTTIAHNRYNIIFKQKNQGNLWLPSENVSTQINGQSVSPAIKVDSDFVVHFIWADNSEYDNITGDFDVFYRNRSLDGIWSQIEVVSKDSLSDVSFPTLAVDHNKTVHVAWRQTVSSYGKIYYCQKKIGGSWSDYEIASNKTDRDASFPVIFVDSTDKVHLSWWIVASVLNEDYDCPACENYYIDRWVVVYNYRIPAENSNDNESTDNGNPSDDHNSNTTPGFELYLLFCGILLLILFKMKK